jgi:hypothetical protein
MLKIDYTNNNLLHQIWKMGHFVMLNLIFGLLEFELMASCLPGS